MKDGNRSVRGLRGVFVAVLLVGLAACGQADRTEVGSTQAIERSSEPAPAGASNGVITQAQLVAAMEAGEAPRILDVRSEREFSEGHIEGAINVPFDELPQRAAEIGAATDAPIVVYCRTGRRAGIAEAALTEAGYTNLMDLEGHIEAWKGAGLPLVSVEAD